MQWIVVVAVDCVGTVGITRLFFLSISPIMEQKSVEIYCDVQYVRFISSVTGVISVSLPYAQYRLYPCSTNASVDRPDYDVPQEVFAN